MSFAENLKLIRKERNLSQEDHNAIISGITIYTLKYSVKTKKRLAGIKIISNR